MGDFFWPKTVHAAACTLVLALGLPLFHAPNAAAAAFMPVHSAWAKTSTSPPAVKAKKTKLTNRSQSSKKTKIADGATPVQYAPSGEAMPARERRLLRECKGRPNAGACLGYAS